MLAVKLRSFHYWFHLILFQRFSSLLGFLVQRISLVVAWKVSFSRSKILLFLHHGFFTLHFKFMKNVSFLIFLEWVKLSPPRCFQLKHVHCSSKVLVSRMFTTIISPLFIDVNCCVTVVGHPKFCVWPVLRQSNSRFCFFFLFVLYFVKFEQW